MAGKKIKYSLHGMKASFVVVLVIAAFGLGLMLRSSSNTSGVTVNQDHLEIEEQPTTRISSMYSIEEVVIEKCATEGIYIQTEAKIFAIRISETLC